MLTLFVFTACASKCPLCCLRVYFASMPKASGWTVLVTLTGCLQCSQFRDTGSGDQQGSFPGWDDAGESLSWGQLHATCPIWHHSEWAQKAC